jgi:hypothetical protein
MRILFIGDIVGKPGAKLVRTALARLIEEGEIDFVVANGENLAGGSGVTPEIADELLRSGVDVLTSGNHIWDKKQVYGYIEREPRLLRPANYPPGAPGQGYLVGRTRRGDPVAVLNVMGRVFMQPLDNPFGVVLNLIERARRDARVIIVDFHAEATSEKVAMGWHVDGLVTALIGTHTHVQTADERVLPKGTAYITDVGMTGPHDSVIGVAKEPALQRFVTGLPARFDVASDDVRLHAVVVDADRDIGRARAITRLSLTADRIESHRPRLVPTP